MIGDAITTVLAGLLEGSHFITPDEVPTRVAEHARNLGAEDAAIYLVDYDQRLLVPVPNPKTPPREVIPVEGTLAGRCYRLLDIQESTWEGGRRMWVPILDGTERLGVLELTLTDDSAIESVGDTVLFFASLVAELIVTKAAYGDFFELVRRRQPMTLAAELAWQLLPPLTFGTDNVVISAVLVPPHNLGGDSFDYAVDSQTARIAVFDAMGHGLESGLLATVAVAAYRNSRRRLLSLEATVAAVDGAILAQFGPERFVTAVLAELDLDTGCLRWSISGHPPPLLLRRGKIVKTLSGNTGLPLGLGMHEPVAEEGLEPGDQVIFYSDGVVEARSAEGEFFGVERLADHAIRASASGNPAPETMRRLIHAILDHQSGDLQDDATIVLVEWSGSGSDRLDPA